MLVLLNKNAELNIEFKSQEKDKDLLIKQIIKQKKINQENIARLAKSKQIAEELEKKLKEEQRAEDTAGIAESKLSNDTKSKSKGQVKRKKLKSAAGNRRSTATKASRIILSQSK